MTQHSSELYLIRQNFRGGKTFAVFTVFQPIAKVFPLNHLPCTVHNGMGLMDRESFPVKGVFCAQPRKVFPLESFGVYGIVSLSMALCSLSLNVARGSCYSTGGAY